MGIKFTKYRWFSSLAVGALAGLFSTLSLADPASPRDSNPKPPIGSGSQGDQASASASASGPTSTVSRNRAEGRRPHSRERRHRFQLRTLPGQAPLVSGTSARCDATFRGEALAFVDPPADQPEITGEVLRDRQIERSFLTENFCLELGRFRRHHATSCDPEITASGRYAEGLHNAALLGCRCAYHYGAGNMPLMRRLTIEVADQIHVPRRYGRQPGLRGDERPCGSFLNPWIPPVRRGATPASPAGIAPAPAH